MVARMVARMVVVPCWLGLCLVGDAQSTDPTLGHAAGLLPTHSLPYIPQHIAYVLKLRAKVLPQHLLTPLLPTLPLFDITTPLRTLASPAPCDPRPPRRILAGCLQVPIRRGGPGIVLGLAQIACQSLMIVITHCGHNGQIFQIQLFTGIAILQTRQVIFINMGSPEHQYLKKLLGRQHSPPQLEQYLSFTHRAHEQHILNGDVAVKDTSDDLHIGKSMRDSRVASQNMRYARNQLERNLRLLESRIEEMTEPARKDKAMTQDERIKFVSQMARARRELQKSREKQMEESRAKQQAELSRAQEEARRKEDEERQRRKQELMKKSQSLELYRKTRIKEAEDREKELRQHAQHKILSERMMQKYKKYQLELLEERKKKLAEIRNLHKPLSKQEFEQHAEKINQLKEERTRSTEKKEMDKLLNNPSKNVFKSHWYEQNKEKQREYIDEIAQLEREKVRDMMERLRKYGQYVRENFKPEVADRSRVEGYQVGKSMVRSNPTTQQLRKLGLKYLEWSKQQKNPNHRKKTQEQSNHSDKKQQKKIDYLQEMRKNNKSPRSSNQFLAQLNKNKNLTELEKAQKILQHVANLERKAKSREQKDKLQKIMIDQQLDTMYMQAIALKLSVLGKN